MKPLNVLPYDSIQGLDENTVKYALLASNYNYRRERSVAFQQDVGSTLFTCKGCPNFGPLTANSLGGTKRNHSERVSLLSAINTAIANKWGPFENLSPIKGNSLSIEQINANKGLLNALQQLDGIYIFTERKNCDYSKKPDSKEPSDNGCAVYLRNLDEILGGDKLNLYSHFSTNVVIMRQLH